jgi:hypothetical protein
MANFSFTKIDVPAAAGTYEYICVDGVDAAGEAVGNYGNVDESPTCTSITTGTATYLKYNFVFS